MTYQTSAHTEPGLGELFSRLSSQASQLFRQEMELAQAEVTGKVTRAGRDLAFGGVASRGKVSIHAPARGATSPPSSPPTASTSFNSRARAGRDVSNSKCG